MESKNEKVWKKIAYIEKLFLSKKQETIMKHAISKSLSIFSLLAFSTSTIAKMIVIDP